jgi:hypothetical protein
LIDRLVNQVHWPFFVEAFLGLLFLWLVKKLLLHVSVAHTLKTISTEFIKLLQLKIDAGSINALTILSLIFPLVLYLFAHPFRELLDLLRAASETRAHSGEEFVFLTALALIGVVGLLSVAATRR